MNSDTLRRQMGLDSDVYGVGEEEGGLPWLEPTPEPQSNTLSLKSLAVIGAVFLLVFIGLMAFFYNRISGGGGPAANLSAGVATMIAAPSGPYKIRPDREDTRTDFAFADEPGDASRSDSPTFGSGPEAPLADDSPAQTSTRSGARPVEIGDAEDGVVAYARPRRPRSNSTEPVVADGQIAQAVRTARQRAEAEGNAAANTRDSATQTASRTPNPSRIAPASPAPSRSAATRAVPPPAIPRGAFLLQLGAFSSSDGALNGWNIFSSQYPGSLAGLTPDVQSFQASNGRTLYRLRAAAVNSRDAAQERCDTLKAARQACFVVER